MKTFVHIHAFRLWIGALEPIDGDDRSSCLDIELFGAALRCFTCTSALPYRFHRWGFYGFGFARLGFMFWPSEPY